MRARWNRQLYRQAAREIEMSFAEARKRLHVEGAPEATGSYSRVASTFPIVRGVE
jgi:hypothetical protein